MASILSAKEISLKFNERVVLDNTTMAIDERDRIGMVGRNGSGKSSFIKILTGLMKPDSGEVNARRGLITGYLPQQFALNPELTVRENVREGARHVLDLIHDFENLPADSPRHEQIETEIMRLDGWTLDHRIQLAMEHLNCPDGDREIRSLSGGEHRRVALCRSIVSRPDLLILDEPTNHLDTESIEWLREFLENYPGAFLLVTHDRYFLDSVTNTIAELSNGQIYSYTGNYTDYLLAKAEREATAEITEHKRQMFLRRELEWVRKSPKARTTKSKSRTERFEQIANDAPPEIDKDVDLVIPPPPQLGNRTVELNNVGMELGGKRLFSNINLNFEAGRKFGITGRNGLGKTTLLKLILRELQPLEGTVKIGQLTVFNYVDQSRLQLNEEKTVLDEIYDGTEFVIFGGHKLSLRAYLKRFLFTDDRITTQVKYLSGGERSRLLLARILKRGGNFLILDEPTNDLDLPTLRVLEEALIAFEGIVAVVSHDRYFLNRVCTDILAFEGDGIVVHSVGNYDYYVEKRARSLAKPLPEEIPAEKPAKSKAPQPAEPAKPAPKGARKLTFKEQKELEGIEVRITESEAEIERIEAMFAQPDFHRTYGQQTEQFKTILAETRIHVADLYQRWEQLEAIKQGAEAANAAKKTQGS